MKVKLDETNTPVIYPYTLRMLKQDNPYMSFPRQLPEALWLEFNCHDVVIAPKPEYDPKTETINTNDLPTLIDNTWTISWNIQPKSQSQQDNDLAILRELMTLSAVDFRLALLSAGILDDFITTVSTLDREIQIKFEHGTNFNRNTLWIISVLTTLGYTDTDIDTLFTA